METSKIGNFDPKLYAVHTLQINRDLKSVMAAILDMDSFRYGSNSFTQYVLKDDIILPG